MTEIPFVDDYVVSSSELGDELSELPDVKRARRQSHVWLKKETFASTVEAEQAVLSREVWKKSSSKHVIDGFLIDYRCSPDAYRRSESPVGLYLLYYGNSKEVGLFETKKTDGNNNNEPTGGLSQAVWALIRKPNALFNPLRRGSLPVPGKPKLETPPKVQRKDKVGTPNDLRQWCQARRSKPETKDKPFVLGFFIYASESSNPDEQDVKKELSSQALLQNLNKSEMVQADGTFKDTWRGYPFAIFNNLHYSVLEIQLDYDDISKSSCTYPNFLKCAINKPTAGMRDTDNGINLTERRQKFLPQQSTVWTRRQQAVCVRRAYKKYGEKKSPNVILDGLNMTVAKGCIYGLLGASGCGKTTLLSCIVGRRRLNAGEIWVLGGKPGSAGSGVPGPRIGYMPQEVALNKEFTIRESLYYFGWINGMSTKEINPKVEFLISFLMLPSADRYIKNLSGGQQRRVSLACALLHEPELLILDEPTVGVDPVLRQSIWDHLVKICKDGSTTVIITTHYIDETRQAHMIGLMRGGRLLAEESPDDLLQKYNSDSLEDVFLKLSIIQNRGKRRRSSILHDVTASITVPESALPPNPVNLAFDTNSEISGEFGEATGPPSISKRVSISITHERTVQNLDLPPDDDANVTLKDRLRLFKFNHMRALVWKNFLWMWRNVAIMLFIMGLPIFQIILFCLTIGKDPVGLHVAVVNHELQPGDRNCSFMPTQKRQIRCYAEFNSATNTSECVDPEYDCIVDRLSCQFLQHLEKRRQKLDFFDDVHEAKRAVHFGKAWAVLEFPEQFTEALKNRSDLLPSQQEDEEMTLYYNSILTSSSVNIWLDQSNQQISLLLQRDFSLALKDFMFDLATACGFSPKLLEPIRFNKPIYGPEVPNFTDFAAPGVMLTIVHFLAVALTSGAMLIERNEGILERSLVSGVTGIEVLLGHVTCQLLVMIFQTTAVVGVTFWLFNLTIEGSVFTASVLVGLTGLCGMCFGFVVSCVTDSERNATYLALGSFLPMVMLCGIIWPIEGMHTILRAISYVLPLTLSTESLRSIMARGWSIYQFTVFIGFCSTVIWILFFLSFSVILIKFKKG